MNRWLVWDSRRWRVDETERARHLARLTMAEFFRQAASLGEGQDEYTSPGARLREFASSSANAHGITNMLVMARSYPGSFVEPCELDTHPYLLNFLNGTVDLRTGIRSPHNPEHYITKLVHHDYRPGAGCRLWLEFLSQIMGGNKELVRYLQKAFGYSLTGTTIGKAVFVLFGPRDRGKTTMLSTFRRLIAEYAALMQIESLMARKQESSSIQEDLADLRGARFVMSSEGEKGQKLSVARLKRICQGMGTIKAIRKYEHSIEFPETHKLWMDTNHKPVIPDSEDDAVFSRLHPIPFDVVVQKIDRELSGKLLEESEGILAWAVDGAKHWYRDGLTKPAVVNSANEQWRSESDWLAPFLEDRCIIDAGRAINTTKLFQAYAQWAENTRRQVHTIQDFKAKITHDDRIIWKHTNVGNTYQGVDLRKQGVRVPSYQTSESESDGEGEGT